MSRTYESSTEGRGNLESGDIKGALLCEIVCCYAGGDTGRKTRKFVAMRRSLEELRHSRARDRGGRPSVLSDSDVYANTKVVMPMHDSVKVKGWKCGGRKEDTALCPAREEVAGIAPSHR